jgi:heavy metal sensor kinase
LIRGTSISLRLTIWFSGIFFAGLIIFGIVMWIDLSRSLSVGRTKTLHGRAERVAELLVSSRGEPAQARDAAFHELTHVIPEGRLIAVFDMAGHRIFPASLPAETAFSWPKFDNTAAEQEKDVEFAGQPYRVYVRPFHGDSLPVLICVAGQLVDNRLLLRRFCIGLLVATPLLLTLSALGGYTMSRRALAPVDRITVSARSISIKNISRRLPVLSTGDELQRLAETCNDMLARIESAVTQLRQFTADASHDLRTPLSFIRTVAEVALRNSDVDAESKTALQDIVEECDKAARLLEDMLTLARADAGVEEQVFEVIDIGQVFRDVSAKFRPLAEARQQKLSTCIEGPALVPVLGDYAKLRRLLNILLDNAIKYTPVGGTIEATLSSGNGSVEMAVKDSGIGIPDSDLSHIFDRFYRVDPSRGQVEGTGLGLAIAQWIADVHHATLHVKSTESVGSCFFVVFPLAEAGM